MKKPIFLVKIAGIFMSKLSAKTVFIFDWDGTLLDVSEQIVSSLKHAINTVISDTKLQLDFPLLKRLPLVTPMTLRCYVGLRFKEKILPDLFPEVCQFPKLVDIFYHTFISHYRKKKSKLFPGVNHLLQIIKNDPSFGVALATNKSRALLIDELSDHGLSDFFDYIVCGDDASHGGKTKPEPDMLNNVCGHFPEATHWYMIGDSPADVLASKKAEHPITSVGVINNQPIASSNSLEETNPDFLLHKISELPQYTFAKAFTKKKDARTT